MNIQFTNPIKMKSVIKFLLFFAMLFPLLLAAQEEDSSYFQQHNYYNLTFSTNGSQHAGALAWNHQHGVGKSKKLSIGYGIRLTSQLGKHANFITAPSSLTTVGGSGPLVIFNENIPGNFDTIHLASYNVNSLNLSIHLNYAFNVKWEAEFNIDALGFSFGAAQNADYNSTKRLQSPNQNTVQPASPTTLNALLISDNDIGSLNSEILLKYWFKPQWAIKVGGTFIFAEYTTDNQLFLNNDRFRNKAFMGMIGISYSPYRIK